MPAGWPRDIVAKVQGDLAKLMRTPETKKKFSAMGGIAIGNSPETFAAYLKADMARWSQVSESNQSPRGIERYSSRSWQGRGNYDRCCTVVRNKGEISLAMLLMCSRLNSASSSADARFGAMAAAV